MQINDSKCSNAKLRLFDFSSPKKTDLDTLGLTKCFARMAINYSLGHKIRQLAYHLHQTNCEQFHRT